MSREFKINDLVELVDDPRQRGQVTGVLPSGTIRVLWTKRRYGSTYITESAIRHREIKK